MKHLTKREMQPFVNVLNEQKELSQDWPRRRRNALLALMDLDRNWMDWVRREIHPCSMTIQQQALEIEWRARALLLPRYRVAFGEPTAERIFGDRPFTDRGNLSPG